METSHRQYTVHLMLENLRAYLVYDEATQVWTAEAYLQVPGGIRFLEKRYSGGDMPGIPILIADAARLGWHSYRPAYLGTAFDPSMSHPVLALFLHCCWLRRLEAEKLVRAAYPYSSEDLRITVALIAAQAAWEGTEYPEDWSAPALIGRLLVALDQVGYRDLADALQNQLIEG